jgi:hypothetical protein
VLAVATARVCTEPAAAPTRACTSPDRAASAASTNVATVAGVGDQDGDGPIPLHGAAWPQAPYLFTYKFMVQCRPTSTTGAGSDHRHAGWRPRSAT